MEIKIDDKKCIKCKDCIEICPSDVFIYNNERDIIEVVNLNECIECCGCVEICPVDAIKHSSC